MRDAMRAHNSGLDVFVMLLTKFYSNAIVKEGGKQNQTQISRIPPTVKNNEALTSQASASR